MLLQYEFQLAGGDSTRTSSVSTEKFLLVKWKFSPAHNNEVVQTSYLLSAEGTECLSGCFARGYTEACRQTSIDL